MVEVCFTFFSSANKYGVYDNQFFYTVINHWFSNAYTIIQHGFFLKLFSSIENAYLNLSFL
jgi:hypothetical protein